MDILHSMQTEQVGLRAAIKSLVLFEHTFYMMTLFIVLSILVLIVFYIHQSNLFRLGLNIQKLSSHTIHKEQEKQILEIFHQISHQIGLKSLPALWIADHNFSNAFSSGVNENTALVVLTKGLIECLDLDEIKAVLTVLLLRIQLRETQLTQTVSFMSHRFLLFLICSFTKKFITIRKII